MSAKEFLNRIRTADMMIDCKLEQVERLKALLSAKGVRYDKEKVHTNSHEDMMANTVIKIIELEEKINCDIDELVDCKNQAREFIEQLDNSAEKVILYKRYFDNKSFEQVSVECNYSWRHTHRIHANALINLDKIMKN